MDMRITIPNCPEVALEVPNVNRIEPNLRIPVSKSSGIIIQNKTHSSHPEPHIRFCEFATDKVFVFG